MGSGSLVWGTRNEQRILRLHSRMGAEMKKRILLVQPPLFFKADHLAAISHNTDLPALPHHLLFLGSFLKRLGLEVLVVALDTFFPRLECRLCYDGTRDSEVRFAQMCKKVLAWVFAQFPADVVGLSAFSRDWYTSRVIIRAVKSISPGTLILVGGPDPTFDMAPWLEIAGADAVVRGEGELPMRELAERNFNFEGVKGISFRDNGEIVDGGMAEPPREHDLQMPVNYGLLLTPPGFLPHWWSVNFCYSRGCPYACSFCVDGMLSRGLRFRSIESVRLDLEEFSAPSPYEYIGIADAIINVSQRHFQQLCSLLRDFNHLKICVWSKFDCLRKEHVQMMKGTAIKGVTFGLESVSPRVLAAMRKKSFSLEKIKEQCAWLREADIQVGFSVIIGHPRSRQQDDLSTYEWIAKMIDEGLLTNFAPFVFRPFPGTTSSTDPSFRLVVKNKAEWTHEIPLGEIVDEEGKVTYSIEEMAEICRLYAELGKKVSLGWAKSLSAAGVT